MSPPSNENQNSSENNQNSSSTNSYKAEMISSIESHTMMQGLVPVRPFDGKEYSAWAQSMLAMLTLKGLDPYICENALEAHSKYGRPAETFAIYDNLAKMTITNALGRDCHITTLYSLINPFALPVKRPTNTGPLKKELDQFFEVHV